MAQNYKDFAEKVLLKAAEYTGNKEPGIKQFSASMLGNDVLSNYLKFKHGSKDGIKFEANTFGSIFHLGAELAFKDIPDVDTECSMKVELSNGWTISGSVDLVLHEFKQIVDWKTTTTTAISKVHQEGKDSAYALQLGVYKYLLLKTEDKLYNTSLGMVDKGYSYFKVNKNDQLTFVDVETYTPDEIEEKLLAKTNELQHYIDLDIMPDKCANIFPMKRKGEPMKPMRCLYYCDQKDHCPYYYSEHHEVNRLMDL